MSGRGRPFTADEDARLIAMWREGLLLKVIGQHLGRSVGSIDSRARTLKLPGLLMLRSVPREERIVRRGD